MREDDPAAGAVLFFVIGEPALDRLRRQRFDPQRSEGLHKMPVDGAAVAAPCARPPGVAVRRVPVLEEARGSATEPAQLLNGIGLRGGVGVLATTAAIDAAAEIDLNLPAPIGPLADAAFTVPSSSSHGATSFLAVRRPCSL